MRCRSGWRGWVLVTGVIVGSAIAHMASGGPDLRVENLRTFARLYGYVRYFHPSDAAAGLDWDGLAIYGAARVKDAKSPGDLQRVLQELFSSIAPTVAVYAAGSTAPASTVAIPAETTGLKIIAWQHLGVEGGSGSTYRSVRLNRPVDVSLMRSPGILLQSLDATAYRGREIRLTAAVRTGTGTSRSHAQLWMRVDRTNRQPGFFDNMNDRPISSDTWRDYGIAGHVAPDAVYIVFGAILTGHLLMLDDVRLSVRREDGTWEPVPVNNASFEAGENGQAPPGWIGQTPGVNYKTVMGEASNGKAALLMERQSITAASSPPCWRATSPSRPPAGWLGRAATRTARTPSADSWPPPSGGISRKAHPRWLRPLLPAAEPPRGRGDRARHLPAAARPAAGEDLHPAAALAH